MGDVNLINGRTAEEIKESLMPRCGFRCEGCPVDDICLIGKTYKDALALIERLEAAVPRWISVEERKPKGFVSVQVYMTDAGDFPSVREGYYVDDDRFYIPALHELHPVSHWKPFDEPPKGADK